MSSERTGKAAASKASEVLRDPKSTRDEKTAAASALAQRDASKSTSPAAARSAARVLDKPTSRPAAKTAAATALTQKPGKR